MRKEVSAAILYNAEKQLLLQKRQSISRLGEEWGFFGGGLEGKETREEALKRELKEELCYNIKTFSLFRSYSLMYEGGKVKVNFYLAPFSDMSQFRQQEGDGMKLFTLEQALTLKMMPNDKRVIEELGDFFKEGKV